LRDQPVDVRKRTRGSQINTAKATRPSKQVKVWIDESREDGFPRARKQLGARGEERFELVLGADRQDLSLSYSYGFRPGMMRVKSENMSAVQNEISRDTGMHERKKRRGEVTSPLQAKLTVNRS
jgi:hypothetical protein